MTDLSPVGTAPVRIAHVPLALIDPNPDQPRQHFDEAALAELAASIREKGLMQAIVVTEREDGRFMIVSGERRWRAHKLNGAATILAKIEAPLTPCDVMVRAIMENAARRDVSPLEEAVAYQRCIDMGLTVEELARQLGVSQPWRISDRLALLALRPEYQTLLRSNALTVTQAQQMATLAPRDQDALFRAIKAGECPTSDALRARAAELRDAAAQTLFTLDEPPPVSEAERQRARTFERRVAKVAAMLRAGTVNNEVVALRAVSPHKAGAAADYLAAMRGDLARLERALRDHAAVASPLAFDAAPATPAAPTAKPTTCPDRSAAAKRAWITIRANRAAKAAVAQPAAQPAQVAA